MVLPVPSEMTAAVGGILTAAQWNSNVRDGINFLSNRPIFVGRQATAQSIPNNAFTPVTMDTSMVDDYGGHSTSVNSDRYTAVVPGWYDVLAAINYVTNTTGRRLALLKVNNSNAAIPYAQVEVALNTANGTCVLAFGKTFLNVGDYVNVSAFQSSGAALLLGSQTALIVQWAHA